MIFFHTYNIYYYSLALYWLLFYNINHFIYIYIYTHIILLRSISLKFAPKCNSKPVNTTLTILLFYLDKSWCYFFSWNTRKIYHLKQLLFRTFNDFFLLKKNINKKSSYFGHLPTFFSWMTFSKSTRKFVVAHLDLFNSPWPCLNWWRKNFGNVVSIFR